MPEDDKYRLDELEPKTKKSAPQQEEEEAPNKYATEPETAPDFIDAEVVDAEELEETDVGPESKDDSSKGSKELQKFNKMKAGVALVRTESGKLKFDYESKEGEKEARSHINTLRGMKGDVGRQKTALNVQARKHIETVNDTAKDLIKDLDEIIQVHQKPLDEKAERETNRKNNHLQNLEALALPTDIPHDVDNLEILVNRFGTITIDKSWEEYREQGDLILGRTLGTLNELLEGAKAKVAREQEKAAHDKQVAEQKKEMAELKASNAKLKADAEKAETERIAAENKVEDDRIAAIKKSEDEKAEIKRKGDEEKTRLEKVAADAAQAVEDEKQRKIDEDKAIEDKKIEDAKAAEQAKLDEEARIKREAEEAKAAEAARIEAEKQRKIREEEIRKEAAAETKRIADAEKAKEAEAEQQRKDDEAHRVKLQSESAVAIEGLGVEFEVALRIVREIGAGKVPYISMKF